MTLRCEIRVLPLRIPHRGRFSAGPHLIDRPLALLRTPEGIAGEKFFQKSFKAHVKVKTLDDGAVASRHSAKREVPGAAFAKCRFASAFRARYATGTPSATNRTNSPMDQNLERYLNDHLAGSCGAVRLIDDLAGRQDDVAGRDFFLGLKAKVEGDQVLLRDLLERAGMKESGALQAAGSLTARASRLKLMWEGFEPGNLGMFEALEMLALGIQGKRLLWLVLAEIAPHFPEWQGIPFADLELEAIRQRDAVEERRIEEGRNCLIDVERRALR